MKRSSVYCFSLAAIVAGSFASCQDYDAGFTEDDIFNSKYSSSFEKAFGKIDPEQNWGFDPVVVDTRNLTRGSNPNSNQWSPVYHYDVPGGTTESQESWRRVPGDVTNYERAYVYWWFSTHTNLTSLSVNWSEFFLENVWGQPEHTTKNADNSSFTSQNWEQFGMDHLRILTLGYSPVDFGTGKNEFDISSTYEHILDFNAAGAADEQVMFVHDVSTQDFAYHASEDDAYHNNWTIQYINGNYYLAFDYEAHKGGNNKFAEISCDGYYNDWIMKLSAGEHTVTGATRRIMCEDLGNTLDWDFNDVVFDVTPVIVTANGITRVFAQITLQAAGGTLPVYIGQVDDAHEVHHLFGYNGQYPPINVKDDLKRPSVVFHLDLEEGTHYSENNGVYEFYYDKIPVYVPSHTDQTDANGSFINVVPLTAEKGKAPQKFACPVNTYWLKEMTHIELGHPNFWKWVAKEIDEDHAFNRYVENTSISAQYFDNLYKDLGKPSSVTYHPGVDGGWTSSSNTGEILPWKDLWEGRTSKPENSKFTESRSQLSEQGRYYVTTFEEQAPYIYETSSNEDPLVVTAGHIATAISEMGYRKVWPVVNYYDVILNVDSNDHGSVTGAGNYEDKSQVTISAIPNLGYVFDHWLEDGNTQSSRTITINGSDVTYTAVFVVDPYSETVVSLTSGINNNLDLYSYVQGLESFKLRITGNPGVGISIRINSKDTPEFNYYAIRQYTTGVDHIVTGIGDMFKIEQNAENITQIDILRKPAE